MIPRLTNEEQVVKLDPSEVRVGYLLHDGMVTSIEIRYDPETGKPVEYLLDTPHAVIATKPGDQVIVYTRVTPEVAGLVMEAYEELNARPIYGSDIQED